MSGEDKGIYDTGFTKFVKKAVLPLAAVGLLTWGGVSGYNKIQDNREQVALEQRRVEAHEAREALEAKQDSLRTYTFGLIEQGNLDLVPSAIEEAKSVGAAYFDLENTLRAAQWEMQESKRMMALRLEFVGNKYIPKEGETLSSIAPKYWEALNGHAPKTDEEIREVGNLWMDMVKYRREVTGKWISSEIIIPGQEIAVPEKGLTEILLNYKGHSNLSF